LRVIPDKNFGIFITTIFIILPPDNYHLKRHKYAIKTIRSDSTIATMYKGNTRPASIPTQKVSAARPMALQPNEHNMVEPAFPTGIYIVL